MTIELDVEKLYEHWQPSQKDDNIRPDSLKFHEERIGRGDMPDPITIEKLQDVDGTIYVRTADGRHRLTAAHNKRVDKIKADDNEAAQMAKMIFDL